MRRMFCISLLLLSCCTTFAQSVSMKNGKVYKGDSVYFSYEKLGKAIYDSPIEKGEDISNHYGHPEATGDAFQDMIFGLEYQPLIYVRARLFASARQSFLLYFYNVQFGATGKEMNLVYHPLLIQTLVKDMVAFSIVEDGFLNVRAVDKLIKKWKRKPSYLTDKELQHGIINNYNVSKISPKPKEQNTIEVTIKANDIYYKGEMVARYKVVQHMPIVGWSGSTKNNNLYVIEKPGGAIIAWVKVPLTRPVFHLMPADKKVSFPVVTTDRDERKIIASAMKVLIVMQQEKSTVKN